MHPLHFSFLGEWRGIDKKRFRWIPAALAGGLVLAIVIQIGRFVYHSEYKITEVAVSPSPDGFYQVALQAVGQPDWPFGAAAGRRTRCTPLH